MKRAMFFVAVLLLVFSAMPVAADNGAPSGAHYSLNIIGVPKDKNPDFDGGSGHRIFVKLWGADTKFLLQEGDFAVLDGNGTDGTAMFQLPNPDPDGDGTTAYSVYVRALGKPGGKAIMQSCYAEDGVEWCAVEFADGVQPITIERFKGKSSFVNVSKELLFVDYCTLWDTTTDPDTCLAVDQIALFSNDTLGYLWDYDNYGLKLAQFRFYEVPTDTPW